MKELTKLKKLSRILCLLLTFIMVFSAIYVAPANAEEPDAPPETESVTVTEPELTEPTTETIPESTELPAMYATRATYENGKYRETAYIYTTNGQYIEYTYDGEYNKLYYVMAHSLWYEGQWRPAYCIEPGKAVHVNGQYSSSENYGNDPWGKLDFAKQRAVSLALLYGYPNGIYSDDMKTQLAYQLATTVIVHEIILGFRENVHPYARVNDHYFDVFGGGVPGKKENLEAVSSYYTAINHKYLKSEDIWYAYDHIANSLKNHDLVPSFASGLANLAPTHTMQANGDGTFSITLTDTNNVLSAYDFVDTEDLTFTKSEDGTSLTVTTSSSNINGITVAPARVLPSAENTAFLIWNTASGSQQLCTLKAAQNDPVPAYFKLRLPQGNVEVEKIAEDGCVEGWQFGIYTDKTCRLPAAQPVCTDSDGKAVFPDLPAGTYWVMEIGNEYEEIESKYYCLSENPQAVTVVPETTCSVTFENAKIRRGHLTVNKLTNTNTDLAGWRFALYYDQDCKILAFGPMETDSSGIALFKNVKTGDYWLKELGHKLPEINDLYTCASLNPQSITITEGDTQNIYFRNETNTGTLTIHKTDPYGNALSDAHFLLEWSESGSIWNPVTASTVPGPGNCITAGLENGQLVTDSSGSVSFEGLSLGLLYRLTEVKAPDGFQLLDDFAYSGRLTTSDTITVQVVNNPIFTLPHTGSNAMICVSSGVIFCLLTCIGAVMNLKKKEY